MLCMTDIETIFVSKLNFLLSPRFFNINTSFLYDCSNDLCLHYLE